MPAGRPVTAKQRARVLELQAEGMSRNDIARKTKLGAGTVTKIVHAEGLSFDRAATQHATAAKVIDNKARRTQLSADLLDDAQKLRHRAWSEYSWYERTKDSVERVTADLPPLGEVRNAYTALAIAVDKHAVLERLDTDNGAAGARSMLGELGAALQLAAGAMNETGDGDP